MRIVRPGRPSPALVVATVALIVALGGTSYAAFAVPNNSVGTPQLKNGAVTGAKVANGTLTGSKIKASTLGTVPTATTATNATNATTALNAANAINAVNSADSIVASKLGQVFYRSSTFAIAATTRATWQANCAAGTFAVGGGVTSPDESIFGSDYLVDSHPTAGGAGWAVTVENKTAGLLNYTAFAVCVPAAANG